MQLLMSPASPFARKCRVLLREANLLDTVTEVTVSTSPMAKDATVGAANPLGKIPALLRDHGPAIYDSRVITRFLDEHAGTDFYPASRLYEVLTLEATADGMMEAALAITYEARMRPAAQQSTDWMDAQWHKVMQAVSAIDARWMSHLTGPRDMAQIAVACALSYLDLRHDARGWRQGHDALAAWFAAYDQRPTMRQTAVSA
ncbi:Glutathione S-transferase, N-terminal domain [Loktanella fryxellensis]|uniref:Glutathione S-transferase, N-terminal domain n=1 Tax=Loktanella fryxellensis TaxID=245187 RepID=A0A1H8CZS9_9RHOB|nr:glutathione S-transferase [Loktanella fryxellensis]SEM99848.1 Glutathione S-transferase, N-terminal domain [Loktanella fryxellensis]